MDKLLPSNAMRESKNSKQIPNVKQQFFPSLLLDRESHSQAQA